MLAPEVLENKPYDGKVDVWMLGAMLYFLIEGKVPYEGKTYGQLYSAITKNKVSLTPKDS